MMDAGGNITFWIALSAGFLSFASPCVLPLIPSYLTYVSGMSLQQLKEEGEHPGTRLMAFLHALAFVAGFSTVFILLGAIAGLASFSFQQNMHQGLDWVRRVGGVLVVLFGVHISGLFRFRFLYFEKKMNIQHKPVGFFGSYLVGIAFAAGWTPCIGPILGSILALAAGTSGGTGKGIFLLATYSAGLGIPFLISALLFQGFLNVFQAFKKQIRMLEICAGILMIVVGVMLVFDLFSTFSTILFRYIPVAG